MTYIFSGVLSEESPADPHPNDSKDLAFRSIDHHKIKAGVLFPKQAEDQIDIPNQRTAELINEAGLHGLSNGVWVYYMCWGGDLETVATAKVQDSKIDMDSYKLFENVTYRELHRIFKNVGIEIDISGNFEPFVRNYWGEHGY